MQDGLTQAINLANFAAARVPAYQKFLKKRLSAKKTVHSANDFFQLPIADKKNYIHSFPAFDLLPKGSFPSMTYASSGSSGNPSFWFRSDERDSAGGKLHEQIFVGNFGIKKADPTLVIICFSMGVWVAGSYTLSSCRWITKQGYKLTAITPGIEKHDIFHIFKSLAPKFKNVILAGYPSFVMDILREARLKGLPLPANLKILTAGDSFSEQWRDSIYKILGPKTKPNSVISVYGSADIGAMAFETPLSIYLRRAALNNKLLAREIFGETDKQPALMQFYPGQTFFESVGEELLITSQNTIPLIRYNIHDVGKVINFERISEILARCNIKPKISTKDLQKFNLPFVVKFGRTDVAVTFYALNIYPENIEDGLNDNKIKKIVSGNFKAYNKIVRNHSAEHLCVDVELSSNKNPAKKWLSEVTKSITGALLKTNTEYRKLYGIIGNRALPHIKLTKKLLTTATTSGTLLNLTGKKPKMVA